MSTWLDGVKRIRMGSTVGSLYYLVVRDLLNNNNTRLEEFGTFSLIFVNPLGISHDNLLVKIVIFAMVLFLFPLKLRSNFVEFVKIGPKETRSVQLSTCAYIFDS